MVRYAVKVQHDGLIEGSFGDQIAITFIIHRLPLLFPDFNYDWLAQQMNLNLPFELNFIHEKENLRKCSKYLKNLIDKGDVAVPEAIDNLSSTRVLTMTFEEGCYVNDMKKVQEMGLRPAEIARYIILFIILYTVLYIIHYIYYII